MQKVMVPPIPITNRLHPHTQAYDRPSGISTCRNARESLAALYQRNVPLLLESVEPPPRSPPTYPRIPAMPAATSRLHTADDSHLYRNTARDSLQNLSTSNAPRRLVHPLPPLRQNVPEVVWRKSTFLKHATKKLAKRGSRSQAKSEQIQRNSKALVNQREAKLKKEEEERKRAAELALNELAAHKAKLDGKSAEHGEDLRELVAEEEVLIGRSA